MCWTVRENFDGTKWNACFGRKWKQFDTYEEAKTFANDMNSKLYAGGKLNRLMAL